MRTKTPVMLCKPSHASDGVLHTDQFPNHVVSQSQSHGEQVLPKYLHHIYQWLSLMHYVCPKTEMLEQSARGKKNHSIPPLLISQR